MLKLVDHNPDFTPPEDEQAAIEFVKMLARQAAKRDYDAMAAQNSQYNVVPLSEKR